jgi:hypothetical protein
MMRARVWPNMPRQRHWRRGRSPQRRWGDTRVRNLVHELAERADELGPVERAELRLALAVTDDSDGGDAA